MATRRKYKDGGRVPVDDVVIAADGAPAAPAPLLASPEPPAEDDDAVLRDDAVMRALEATRRAEQLQRQAAPPPTHEAYVDSLPGLTEAKRAFLKSNPVLMRSDIAPIANQHFQAALQQGIADDSPELERFILEKTAKDLAQRRTLAAATSRLRADDEATRQAADALAREAEAIGEAGEMADRVINRVKADYLGGEETAAAPVETRPEPMYAPSSRSRVPVSAPVSRESPSMSTGRPQSFSNSVTLSPAEREIARNSFTDSSMSGEARERLYATNKLRMLKARANGTLNE